MQLFGLRNHSAGVRPLSFASFVVSALVWVLMLSAGCHSGQVTRALVSKPAPAASLAPVSAAQVPFGVGKLAIIDELGCVVTAAHTVRCWGSNEQGQLGQGDLLPRWGGVTVLGLTSVVEVAVGMRFACARTAAGSVWCWGKNDDGQLGVSLPPQSAVPLEVPGIQGALELSVGAVGACARVTTGRVMCWGNIGLAEKRGEPTMASPNIWTAPPTPATRIPSLDGAVQLALGLLGGCALKPNRRVTCWGSGFVADNLGLVTEHAAIDELVSIASSPVSQHVCGLDVGGVPHCFGRDLMGNIDGEIGHKYPSFVVGAAIAGIGRMVSVVTGYTHSCAAALSGDVWCWGERSRLYQDDKDRQFGVRRVPGLVARFGLSAGSHETCALASPDSVSCLGELSERAFVQNSPRFFWRPRVVSNISGAVDIAVTRAYACAVLEDGSVWCWGVGYALGGADGQIFHSYLPLKISGLEGARSVVCESHYCAVILRDGTVVRWGGFLKPEFALLEKEPSTQVALADNFACVLLKNGRVTCGDHRVPFPEKALEIAVDAGRAVCMRGVSGAIFCWLDRGAAAKRPAVKVRGIAHASKLWNVSSATTADGKSFGFSWPDWEATEDPPAPASAAPVPTLPQLEHAIKRQGGVDYGCALRADKTVLCLGEAYTGIQGIGYQAPEATTIDAF